MRELTSDCIREILFKFEQDTSGLHACALVDRKWCQMAIPLLWQNPFREENSGDLTKIIDTYVNLFTPQQRQILQLDEPITTPLFIYPSFVREVDTLIMMIAVKQWLECRDKIESFLPVLREIGLTVIKISKNLMRVYFRDFFQNPQLTNLVESQVSWLCPNLHYLHFSNILFDKSIPWIILENVPNLKHLEFTFCQNINTEQANIHAAATICERLTSLIITESDINTDDICHIIKSASKCLRNFELRSSISVATHLLDFLAKYSRNLKDLKIRLNHNHFSDFIQSLRSWEKLEYLLISCDDIYRPLEIGKYLKIFGGSLPKSLRKLDILCNWYFDSKHLICFFEVCEAKLDYIYFGGCQQFGYDHIQVMIQFLQRSDIFRLIYVHVEDTSLVDSEVTHGRLVAI